MKLYYFFFSLLAATYLNAQTTLEGIVNTYHEVLAIDTCQHFLILTDTDGLLDGQPLLLYQAKGGLAQEENNAQFGQLINLGPSGQYEIHTISSIQGDTVILDRGLVNTYSNLNHLQAVSCPVYQNVLVIDTLQCQSWNGKKGGVIFLYGIDTLELLAPISASEKGFRGGEAKTITPNFCQWFIPINDYFYDSTDWRGSAKGEGVVPSIIDKIYGRGAWTTGGGGGNDHNAGGGGGSLFSAGGKGGINDEPATFGCQGNFPGEGGWPLSANNKLLFFGGGGGAGHGNNSVATSGGIGGGLILLQAQTLIHNGQAILNKGGTAADASGDGAGGGGAGGTVILAIDNNLEGISIDVRGGYGGNIDNDMANRCHGPGGGGAGGQILLPNSNADTILAKLEGGEAGWSFFSTSCTPSSNGATNGQNGQIQGFDSLQVAFSPKTPALSSFLFPAVLCPADTVDLSVTTNLNVDGFVWQGFTNGHFVPLAGINEQQTPNSSQLSLSGNSFPTDSLFIRCAILYACGFDTLFTDSFWLVKLIEPQALFIYTLSSDTLNLVNQSATADSFSWFLNDSLISNAYQPTVVLQNEGTYILNLVVSNQCGIDSYSDSITWTPSFLQEIGAEAGLEIYPNPFSQFLTLKSLNPGIIPWKCFSAHGVIQAEGELSVWSNLSTESWSPGFYYLQFVLPDGSKHGFPMVKIP